MSATPSAGARAFLWRLHRRLLLFVLGLIAFLLFMAWAERAGLARDWIGPIFLFLSVMLYACVGIYGRTADPQEFYVAGRRIPAMYNGMATAADLLLPRLMTGEALTAESVATLGHGGLLGREMRSRFPAYARELPEPPTS